MTHHTQQLSFQSIEKKEVVTDFQGGNITSNAGALMLEKLDRKLGLSQRIADRLQDPRDPNRTTHTMVTLIRQRLLQIALGYEDANDAKTLREDPALKVACGRAPESDDDLASQPTFSRLENQVDNEDIQRLAVCMVDLWLDNRARPKDGRIILDVDASDDETHGQQELAFFHGYYRHYCYLPLFVHDGETGDLILAFLRPGNASAKLGADGLLLYIVERIRSRWPDVEVIIRGDGGFCGEDFYQALERHQVGYVLGLARNKRLEKIIEPLMKPMRLLAFLFDRKSICFAEVEYQAESWSHPRRVIVKAERLRSKDNPRFLVTNLPGDPTELYRSFYCQRGEASENRIKDVMSGCFADRLSCHSYRANFFRLLLHAAAYTLMHHLRKMAAGTVLERTEIDTIRLKLLKVGARVSETCRKIWFHLSSSYPDKALWVEMHRRLVAM